MQINKEKAIVNASVFKAIADDVKNKKDFVVVCRNERYPIKERAEKQFDNMLEAEGLKQAAVYTIADPSTKDMADWLGVGWSEISGYVLFRGGVSTGEYRPLDVNLQVYKNSFEFIKDTLSVIIVLLVLGAVVFFTTFGVKGVYEALVEKLGENGLFSISMLVAIAGFVIAAARKANRVSIDTVGSVAFLVLVFFIGNILIYLFV